MSPIEIRTGLSDKSAQPAAYQIAGKLVITDARLPKLGPFARDGRAAWSSAALRQLVVDCPGPGDRLIYAGRGWVANSWRSVECMRLQNGFRLRIVGLAAFWISSDGQAVILMSDEGESPKDLLMQAALGVPLVLALALQHVFALHVSLVQRGDRYLAFAGESGEGKSTLARFLGFESGSGWRRIIDDMLPVRLRSGKIEALPHFPQLKLGDDAQPVRLAPARVPLAVLYVLGDKEQAADEGVQIAALNRRMAALAVIQHTIAARLFDHPLLADHLAFADRFSGGVPVRRLCYPRRFDQLPQVRAALEEDLATIV